MSFGLIWIFDGILQGQASMPLGMAPQVIAAGGGQLPRVGCSTSSTPWPRSGATTRSPAPAAAVWIQVGIGVWLLAAPRGTGPAWAGLASVAGASVVWVFGEAFGEIFAPGLTWLFGAARGGAVLLRSPARSSPSPSAHWATPRLGRWILRCMGLFFVGMAVLQAWPGRGFWQGQPTSRRRRGRSPAWSSQMAQTPQPHLLASWVAAFGDVRRRPRLGASTSFVVVALAAIGAAFLSAQPPARALRAWSPASCSAWPTGC